MYKSDHIITSKHYLVHFVAAYATGIYLAASFGIIFTAGTAFAICLLSVFSFYTLRTKRFYKQKYIILPIVLAVATFLGSFRIYYAEYIQSNYLRQYQDKEAWLCGTVISDPHLTSSGYYYTFELDVFGVADKTGMFGTVMIYIPQSIGCDFSPSDTVYAWTVLKGPERDEDLSHFDYHTHLRGKNIFLTGTAKNVNYLPKGISPAPIEIIRNSGAWVRSKISYSIDMMFSDNNVFDAVLKGILIGDKTSFDEELYNKFSNSGISHIVAVSGLHMSIMFSFLMIALKRFRLSKRLNLIITIPAIILLMSASAFTPSVCRAAIMILIVIFSTLFREEYNSITSLFLALGLILTAAPYALFSKSLVMSFSATLGIFVYFPYINNLFVRLVNHPRLHLQKHKIIKKGFFYVFSSTALSLSTFLGTAYFLVLFFGGISKAQFLTNLWIIPLVSVIFCLGYICCILYYICPWLVMTILRHPLSWCLEIVRLTVDKFGTPNNVISILGDNLNSDTAILYFGTALMIYMLLKAFSDMRIDINKEAS